MQKHELIARVANVLRENNIRKQVHMDKRILKIVDATYAEEETSGRIVIKPRSKMAKYTNDDVANILEGVIAVILDGIRHGEGTAIKGLGNFSVYYRAPKKVRNINNGEMIDVPERYIVKFLPGLDMREAANMYTLSRINNPEGFKIPDPIYDQFEEPDDEDGDDVDGVNS